MKSLFALAKDAGYLDFNVGAAVKAPPVKNTLAERILAEPDVHRMIALEPKLRNRIILILLYAGGLRISELCGIRWRDLSARDDAGQITIFGKGGKTRAILLSPSTWRLIETLRREADPDAPLFVSREGGPLDASQVHRIVKAAAIRAELPDHVSAHWLRHAHASHSLDRGAPIQPGAGDARSCLGGHHRSVSARPADGQLGRVSRRLTRIRRRLPRQLRSDRGQL